MTNHTPTTTDGTFVVSIPLTRPPMTANQQRRWHWRSVAGAKADTERLLYFLLRAQLPRGLTLGPVHVTVTWFAPNARRRDPDALGPFVKAALDALVRGGYLADDDGTRVLAVEQRVRVDRARPRIDIDITEVLMLPPAA